MKNTAADYLEKAMIEDGIIVTRKDLKPEEIAAYAFIESMLSRADDLRGAAPLWYGWALREAFEAGHKKALKDIESNDDR